VQAAFATGDKRRGARRDRRATEAALVLRQVLEATVLTELLPRSSLTIVVSILQADGGVRCAAFNAAVLALADAGVPLRDTAAAACAGLLDGTPVLDLNHAEEGKGAEVTTALLPATGKLLLLQHEGARCPLDMFEAVAQLAQTGSATVSAFMREQLLERTRQLALARAAERL
jgi:exosome complex component RRP41